MRVKSSSIKNFLTICLISTFPFAPLSYAQEVPSRFKKDIVRAALHRDSDRIAQEDMQRVLGNINMQHRISPQEMEIIFREIGGESKMIPADHMMKII